MSHRGIAKMRSIMLGFSLKSVLGRYSAVNRMMMVERMVCVSTTMKSFWKRYSRIGGSMSWAIRIP